jgi:hypothetical protein
LDLGNFSPQRLDSFPDSIMSSMNRSGTFSRATIPGVDNTVPSLDERPFICDPLELGVLDEKYFHYSSLVNLVLISAF